MKIAFRFNIIIVVILLIAILVIDTVVATSYEVFPDVNDGAVYANEVNTLAYMGIFIGDENGNFNPNNTITRAEFATIMVRLLGEDDREITPTTSEFSDVSSTHWACAYVAISTELGLINGYGDGRFGPNDTLTYEQAIAIILRAFGHEEEAQESSGWPDGYILLGQQLSITRNTEIVLGKPVTRSTVAVLIFNALYLD